LIDSLLFQFLVYVLLHFFALSTANVLVWRVAESEMRDLFDWVLMVSVFFMGEILMVLFVLGFLNLLTLPWVFAVVLGLYLGSYFFGRQINVWEKVRYLIYKAGGEWKHEGTIGVFGFLVLYSGAEFFNSLVQFPWEYDTISYHMPIVIEWLQTGSLWTIFYAVWGGPLGYYPTNHELFVLWQLLPFGADYLANVVNFGVMFGLILVVYKILREMKVSKFLSWLAGALVMIMPVFLRQVGTGQVDLFMTFGIMLVLYYLFRSFKRNDGTLMHPLLISFALMLGTKYLSIVYIIPLAVLYFLLYKNWRHESKRWIYWSVFWVGIVGSLWYWRNLILASNPIFPAQLDLLGVTLFEGYHGLMERIQGLSLWVKIQQPGGWSEWFAAMYKEAGPQVYLVIGAYVLLLFEYFNKILFHRLERGEGRIFTIMLFLVPAYWYLYFIAPYTASMMEQNVRYAMPLLTMAMVMVVYAVEKLEHFKKVLVVGLVGLVWWEFLGLVVSDRAGTQRFMDIMWIDEYQSAFWMMILVVVFLVLFFEVWRRKSMTRYVILLIAFLMSFSFFEKTTEIRDEIRHVSWQRQYEAFPIFEAYEFLDRAAANRKAETGKPMIVANTLNPVYYPLYGPRIDRHVRYVNVNECEDCNYYDYHRQKRGVRSEPNYWL
jgi:4-amino-4-deoxy-L-arabinose transferase-like glycosyltransferase